MFRVLLHNKIVSENVIFEQLLVNHGINNCRYSRIDTESAERHANNCINMEIVEYSFFFNNQAKLKISDVD